MEASVAAAAAMAALEAAVLAVTTLDMAAGASADSAAKEEVQDLAADTEAKAATEVVVLVLVD